MTIRACDALWALHYVFFRLKLRFYRYYIAGVMPHAKLENGKIYKINCTLAELKGQCYIGSTTEQLSARWRKHKHRSKIATDTLHQIIKKYGPEHFTISLVEAFPCKTTKELRSREKQWIAKLSPAWNINSLK